MIDKCRNRWSTYWIRMDSITSTSASVFRFGERVGFTPRAAKTSSTVLYPRSRCNLSLSAEGSLRWKYYKQDSISKFVHKWQIQGGKQFVLQRTGVLAKINMLQSTWWPFNWNSMGMFQLISNCTWEGNQNLIKSIRRLKGNSTWQELV